MSDLLTLRRPDDWHVHLRDGEMLRNVVGHTARMNWRQKVNRRLLVLPLERSDEKRRKASYPELGLAVDHLRTEDIDPVLLPAWLEL